MSRIKQNLALLFAICCVSFAGPLIKVALLLAMPPVAVAFFRLFFSTAFLSVPNARQHGFALYKTLSKKEVGLLVASGLCLALHFFCWISSLSIISTFASTVIVCTQPLFVMVGAFLFLGSSLLSGAARCCAVRSGHRYHCAGRRHGQRHDLGQRIGAIGRIVLLLLFSLQ